MATASRKAASRFCSGADSHSSPPGLVPVGKFKAAGFAVPDLEGLDSKALAKWLKESKAIQWDYLNVIKKKKLDKLTDF